ncbi:MAG: hypothetical protein PHW10_03180 [Candidatus Peribacteraceae bacterium]|nr:hypothetical protein [Candidatus Peribacteraceae bacterium]
MNAITVFTADQPRHRALAETLAPLCKTLFVIEETKIPPVAPLNESGQEPEILRSYFKRVKEAENAVFGHEYRTPPNARTIRLEQGTLSHTPLPLLEETLRSNLIVVFGSSYIKEPLLGRLLTKKAVNLHMGVSPYYRGSACNFWAAYDGRADLVGATIHLLSAGLDSGGMLFHAFPATADTDPFLLGMLAVRAAHRGLAKHIRNGTLLQLEAVAQDKNRELRYSRRADFTDAVATDYLGKLPSPADVRRQLEKRDLASFVRPYVDASH